MKRYDEYSKTELAKVSQEDLNLLVDLELAHAGILSETSPTELPPFDAGIKPTETFYEVFGVLFKNQADAITVSMMSVAAEEYDYYGAGYTYKFPSFDRSNAVSTKVLFKKEDVMRVKAALSARKKAEEVYAEESKKYTKFTEATSKIRSDVTDAYYEACDFARSIELAKQMLEKYRVLADGNEETARNFFRDAYKSNPSLIQEVLEEKEEENV